ncbi:MAG: 5-formyltetrahydrofolate cyclo-ligase [Alphaproteobacteria bacterium]|nr:5-formyltetrahydrofolate cyclo-ligase [Alphaproteobacteria bacterium]HCP01864.1 5-formyltetrahydrofolate cyclo-ligase [Rhodospirillaceae bacterium]
MDIHKLALRAVARDVRDALASGLGAAAATGLAARFMSSPLANHVDGSIVSGYMPMHSEIDPQFLMARLSAAGATLCLPDVVADSAPLVFRRWAPEDGTVAGRYGIAVPSPEAESLTPDVLLVPMLAFDKSGRRLGYGGGYYDRTVASLRETRDLMTVGLAFSGQARDDLHEGAHDMRLDWIVTESAAHHVLVEVR